MTTYYRMAKTQREAETGVVEGAPSVTLPAATSPWRLADTITDLQGAEYDGPTPAPGETVTGVVHARSLSSHPHGPRDVQIKVYVHAHEESEPTFRSMHG